MMSYIKAQNLSVDFPVIGASQSFRHAIINKSVGGILKRAKDSPNNPHKLSVQSLKNINLDIKAGDSIGLIGHNGAGKSTLLRTLAGAYFPTSGTLETSGNIVPLLSLGTGMDGDFTGYENIINYGLCLGYSKKEINALVPDIEEFTELGEFLNLPTRTYSSGMLLRLSFAIATSQNPDILLVDEIFGAGDASFYKKAETRMINTLKTAKIVILASHSTNLISQYCSSSLVLHKGESVFFGKTQDAIKFYEDLVAQSI